MIYNERDAEHAIGVLIFFLMLSIVGVSTYFILEGYKFTNNVLILLSIPAIIFTICVILHVLNKILPARALRNYEKLKIKLQKLTENKVELFQNIENVQSILVHKLNDFVEELKVKRNVIMGLQQCEFNYECESLIKGFLYFKLDYLTHLQRFLELSLERIDEMQAYCISDEFNSAEFSKTYKCVMSDINKFKTVLDKASIKICEKESIINDRIINILRVTGCDQSIINTLSSCVDFEAIDSSAKDLKELIGIQMNNINELGKCLSSEISTLSSIRRIEDDSREVSSVFDDPHAQQCFCDSLQLFCMCLGCIAQVIQSH